MARGKAEMEAKEVRYVGKLQKGRKFFSEFHAHTQPRVKRAVGEGRYCRRRQQNRGVKRMRDCVVSQSLANRHLILKAVAP